MEHAFAAKVPDLVLGAMQTLPQGSRKDSHWGMKDKIIKLVLYSLDMYPRLLIFVP
jgi:hypothetical protein